MLPFRSVTLEDKPLIEKYARKYPTRFLNYSFEVIYLWKDACEFMICEYEGFLLIKTFYYCNHNYFFPIGEGDIRDVVERMIEYSERFKCPFSMLKVSQRQRDILETHFPGKFLFDEVRNEMEYMYLTEKLMNLKGKHLQPKRNHINSFLKDQQWSLEEITSANIEELKIFNMEWESRLNPDEISRSMEIEKEAVANTLEHFSDLSLDGLLLRVDGKVEGFSIGCPTFSDTYLTLFERANGMIRGAYPFINREFTKHFASGFEYVNRAEDCGDSGLRKAKLSYHPEILDTLFLVSMKK